MKSALSDIYASYREFEVLMEKCRNSSDAESQALLRNFSERISDILARISGQVQSLSKEKTGRRAEEEGHRLIARYVNRHRSAIDAVLDIPLPSDIPSMENLLDEAISVIAEILLRRTVRIERIYPVSSGEHGIVSGDGEGIGPIKTAPKYAILLHILCTRNGDPSDIGIAEEVLEKEQFRKIPYKIVYVRTPVGIRTICTSDQIGEKTYVYDGMVDLAHWKESEKWKSLYGLPVRGVLYGDFYERDLESCIFDKWNEEESASSLIFRETGDISDLLVCQNQILEVREKLSEAGIVCERGIWYFGDAKRRSTWPKAGGKRLLSFPNAAFNRERCIGNKLWVIQNGAELAEMFTAIGFRVANEDEERSRWARILMDAKEGLQKVGISYKEGIWYFWDTKGSDQWPTVMGKWLKNFPSVTFNKERGIGNVQWMVLNGKDLAKMFAALGLRVASEDEERSRWAWMLLDMEKELAESGIVNKDGVWHFKNAKECGKWPKINGKKLLRNFPNAAFNKEHGIGSSLWVILSKKDLARMFAALGLRVASE